MLKVRPHPADTTTMGDDHGADPPSARAFPGGRAKLPLINPRLRPAEPEMAIVGTAFVRAPEPAVDDQAGPTRGGFSGYFTYESLFEEPVPTPTDAVRGDDPYRVLRLRPGCSWDDVVVAHRHLAKEFHPDRFVGEETHVLAQAEDEIRRINLAFDELKHLHPEAPAGQNNDV